MAAIGSLYAFDVKGFRAGVTDPDVAAGPLSGALTGIYLGTDDKDLHCFYMSKKMKTAGGLEVIARCSTFSTVREEWFNLNMVEVKGKRFYVGGGGQFVADIKLIATGSDE